MDSMKLVEVYKWIIMEEKSNHNTCRIRAVFSYSRGAPKTEKVRERVW